MFDHSLAAYNRKEFNIPGGGAFAWLFHTTNTLVRLGALAILMMISNRSSSLSNVNITAVKPSLLGGMRGRKRGLFTPN